MKKDQVFRATVQCRDRKNPEATLQIGIPKRVGEAYGIKPGDFLVFVIPADGGELQISHQPANVPADDM